MTKSTKSNWTYYDHFAKVCENQGQYFLRNSLNYRKSSLMTTNVEHKITPAFNLLFSYIPNFLSHYMQIALSYDNEMFEEKNFTSHIEKQSHLHYFNPNESRISSVSRLSSVDTSELIKHLDFISNTRGNFVNYLINTQSPTLLFALENLLQLHSYPTLFIHNDQKYKAKFICSMLAKVGCSRSLSSNISGLHHKTVTDIYASLNPMDADACFSYKLKSPSVIMLNKDKSSLIMLMLSLYTICCRVLTNKLPTSNVLDQEDIPNTISNPLAVGVYQACANIGSLFNVKSLSLTSDGNNFPKFDDFYQFLSIYVNRQVQTVACSNCYTPYLDIKQDFSKDVIKRDLIIPCPSCKKSVEYSLSDWE